MYLVESIPYNLNVEFIKVSLRDTALKVWSYVCVWSGENGLGYRKFLSTNISSFTTYLTHSD